MTSARNELAGAKRVSVVHVADDMQGAGDFYRSLGFSSVLQDDPDCAGWLSADGLGVIVTATAMIARTFGADVANELSGKSIPHIYVRDLKAARAGIGDAAAVIEYVYGKVTEVLVRTSASTFILAEKGK
jgi:hypothetical protein